MSDTNLKTQSRLHLRIKPGASVRDSEGTVYVNNHKEVAARLTIIREKVSKEQVNDNHIPPTKK